MDILRSISPVLEAMPQEIITVDMLCHSGIAVSTTHMSWLLEELLYFVENPLSTFHLSEPLRFYTHWEDRAYLVRLYKLANYLCLPSTILDSIAFACFECFFLTEKWTPTFFASYPLECHLQKLWGEFVRDYEMCIRYIFTTTITDESGRFHTSCSLPFQMGDIYDVFGQNVRTIVRRMRAHEHLALYDLSHYILPHEATYSMDNLLPILNSMCFNMPAAECALYNINWFRTHLVDTRNHLQIIESIVEEASAAGHDIHVCSCDMCLSTHIHCYCHHHMQEIDYNYDYYDDDAELFWERNYGGW